MESLSEGTRNSTCLSLQNSASLLYVYSEKRDSNWYSVPHTHNCAEFYYIVNGIGQFRIDDKIHPVSTGNLIAINSQVVHTEICPENSTLEYIVLGIGNFEFSLPEQPDAHFCIVNMGSSVADMHGYLKTILKEMDQKALGYDTICQSLMYICLTHMMRQLNFSITLSGSTVHNSKEGALIRRYIKEHFRENLDLDMLAEIAHVSKYHLSHTFAKEYGISPISYLLSLRMQESRDLLRTTNYPLSHIARVAGFSSPSYFSQRFRQAEGISPAQYRQKFRKKGVKE